MEPVKLGFRLGDEWDGRPPEEWPVGRLFGVAARLAVGAGWRVLEGHGVSPSGFGILRVLMVNDGAKSSEVARMMYATPATITSVVDTLQRDGHVERRRDDKDRRVVRLYLTDKGRDYIAETHRGLLDDFRALYDFVDDADVPAIRKFLVAAIERFGPMMKGDRP
jgi:DNA-binding MarR family transcriptional regulator